MRCVSPIKFSLIFLSTHILWPEMWFCFQLGILLNSMKRMLDILRPRIEYQLKSWGSCIPDGGTTAPGERLSEVTVMLRTKFRNYLQAVVEKLAENVSIIRATLCAGLWLYNLYTINVCKF